MSQEPDSTTADLERGRHGFTAGQFCSTCDEIDLRDPAPVAIEDAP